MTKTRVKAVVAAILMNLFVVFYSISQIGIVSFMLILMPVLILAAAVFAYLKKNATIMTKIPKEGSIVGIVVGIFLARLLHNISPILEVMLGLVIGMLFFILVLSVAEEDLVER